MRLSQRDIAHGWSKVKTHIGRAWLTGKTVLGTIDRYAGLAGKIIDAASPVLSSEVQAVGRAGLQAYGRGRQQLQGEFNKYEGVARNLQRAAPELF